MIDIKRERKMGADILETVRDIQATPHDNIKRFIILKKKLEKFIKRYQEYTGRDTLDPTVDYGFEMK